MIGKDILKKIRKIEIVSKKISEEIFAGQYHTAFKGKGLEFSEVREYYPGDDIRTIDWNVTSRTGKLFVKQYIEERELRVILAVDLSASLNFFSSEKSKKDIAAEISAIISFTAMINNDNVGLLVFTDEVELFIPPKKGKTHLLRIIREILEFKPKNHKTSIDNALRYLNKVLKKKSIIFLISDFYDMNFENSVKITSKKHDLIAINIFDKREVEIPTRGTYLLKDLENNKVILMDLSSKRAKINFKNKLNELRTELNNILKKYNIDLINIRTTKDYEKPLFEFFIKRKKRK